MFTHTYLDQKTEKMYLMILLFRFLIY